MGLECLFLDFCTEQGWKNIYLVIVNTIWDTGYSTFCYSPEVLLTIYTELNSSSEKPIYKVV